MTTRHAVHRTVSGLSGILALFLFALLPQPGAAVTSSSTPWTPVGPQGNVLALAAGAPGVVYSSLSGKGIFQSADRGASWTNLEQGGLPACFSSSFDAFALAADPQTAGGLYAGTYTGLFHTADDGASWQPAYPAADPLGVVGQVVPVPGSPGHLLALISQSPFNDPPFPPCIAQQPAGVEQTGNGGASWSALDLPPGGYAGLAIDPGHSGRLFVGTLVPSAGTTANRAQIVELEGSTAVRTLPDLPASPFPGTLVLRVDSTTAPSTLFAVATGRDRGIYRTAPPLDPTAPSTAWIQAADGLPAGATLSDLLVDPAFPGTLHAATSGGVFVSHDRGRSWAQEGEGLPVTAADAPLSVLAIDSQPFGPLYVGTLGGGVYRLERPGCPIGDLAVCLNASRFDVGVTFEVGGGPLQAGHAVPLTDDTAAFWFFNPLALEVMVKVLDGEAVDGQYWVFTGGLSDVSYTVRVTDLITGAVKIYPNPHGFLTSLADVFAFPVLTLAPDPPAAAAAAQAPAIASSASRVPAALETSAPPRIQMPLAATARPSPVLAADLPGGLSGRISSTQCPIPGVGRLCLNGGSFQVDVSFEAAGQAGFGRSVPLTDDTGAFYFFSPDNLELMVKVLDGRAVNGHFWVFTGALTDVEYSLRIVDTATGAIRTYDNAAGHLKSFVDTSAF